MSIAQRFADENPFTDGFGSLDYVAADFFSWQTNDRFDAIGFFMTLHHFEDASAVLDRVRALLKPGGTITVIEPARDWFSPLNVAVALLIRLLLSQSDRWYQRLDLPTDGTAPPRPRRGLDHTDLPGDRLAAQSECDNFRQDGWRPSWR